MTENEARDFLGKFTLDRIVYASGKEVDTERFDYFTEVLRMAMIALTDIQKYRAIGTVEECREARERQRVKKPLSRTHCKDGNHPLSQDIGRCPSCNSIIAEDMIWCDECGQKLDWSNTD